jgi:hypothetical protein
MWVLKLFDRDGNELKEGDIVAISDSHNIRFYCEVKYSESEKVLFPFHTFSFHSVVKSKVPDGAIKSTEERYNCWYMPDYNDDITVNRHESYLMEWRTCETLLKMFRIEKIERPQLELF